MKKLVLMFLLAVPALLVTAQSEQSPASQDRVVEVSKKIEKRVAKLTQELDLNSEQQAEIKKMMMEVANDRRAQADARKMKKEAYDEQLKSILSEEQYAKMKEMRKAEKGKMKEKRGERRKAKGGIEE